MDDLRLGGQQSNGVTVRWLIGPISPDCEVKVKFIGPITRQAIGNLILILQLMQTSFDEPTAPETRQEGGEET